MYSLFWKMKAVLMACSPLVTIDQSTDTSTTRLKIVAAMAATMITASAADLVPRTEIAAIDGREHLERQVDRDHDHARRGLSRTRTGTSTTAAGMSTARITAVRNLDVRRPHGVCGFCSREPGIARASKTVVQLMTAGVPSG